MLEEQVASYFDGPLPQKINLISCALIVHISDIKLIRTDTTLDLSQKAEKDMLKNVEVFKNVLTSVELHFRSCVSDALIVVQRSCV